MGAFFTSILAKISAVVGWFGDLFVAVFEALWHVVTDLFCWAFDSFLEIAVSATSAASFDFSSFTPYLGSWVNLPSNVQDVLAAIGLAPAVTIVVAAIGVRLVLQLVPFTRLGS